MGCKERGALPTVTALTAQGITIMHLFVVQVTVGTTHGDTQCSVKKKYIFYVTPLGDRKYQLILAAHRRCFLEEMKLSFPVTFLINVILAKQFIVPKMVKKSVYKK